MNSVNRKRITELMEMIGFIEKDRYYYHPENPVIVEFPPGPLSIGAESIDNVDKINYPTGVLVIISATDCVKGRLAAYYFWHDLQSLSQAILVAKTNRIDFQGIERWSRAESKDKEFWNFINGLEKEG